MSLIKELMHDLSCQSLKCVTEKKVNVNSEATKEKLSKTKQKKSMHYLLK